MKKKLDKVDNFYLYTIIFFLLIITSASSETRFEKDLIYNFSSLFFMAISGICLNIIIGLYYEASILGAFNQVITTYFIFSMIGSLGLQYSLLHYVSLYSSKDDELKSIVAAGILPVIFFSGISTLIYLFSSIIFSKPSPIETDKKI